jgi:hypothetical protein
MCRRSPAEIAESAIDAAKFPSSTSTSSTSTSSASAENAGETRNAISIPTSANALGEHLLPVSTALRKPERVLPRS